MSEFTPGPWSWVIQDVSMADLFGPEKEDGGADHVLSLGPCLNCVRHAGGPTAQWEWGRCWTPDMVDARLIAAAPTMYAALRAMLEYYHSSQISVEKEEELIRAMVAALSAADGKDAETKS